MVKNKVKKEKKLTDKQSMFIKQFLIDLNATQAAIRAGYSNRTARSQGQRLLTNVDISKAIDAGKRERLERVKVDADFVLYRLFDIVESDPCDIINEDGGFKSIHDWPLTWRRMLSAMDIKEITEYQGEAEGQVKIGELVKFRFPDKLKALETLGKHVDVQAFVKKVEHSGNINLAERLHRARKRAANNSH